jgi:hypothetical protein
LPFARVHPALAAPGLFLSRSNVKEEKLTLKEPVVLGQREFDKTIYRFEGCRLLGTNDLRLMQGLFMLASDPASKAEFDVMNPLSPVGQRLAVGFGFTEQPVESSRSKLFSASVSSLATAIGYSATAGGGTKIVRNALDTLAGVRLKCLRDETVVSDSSLIAVTPIQAKAEGFDNARHTMAIALAPALSGTLLGLGPRAFIRIDQAEIGPSLGDGASRILHFRLCSMINQGESKSVSAGTLATYGFGKAGNADTNRRQFGDVAKAMEKLQAIGWAVARDERKGADCLYAITRPKRI